MLLRDLPPLLREEPGFASVLGRSSAVLAVPEPARALAVAGLATLSSRRPIVVAVPTTGDADRVANDLRSFLGPDAVDTFPAWETLPFERVSPSVETMGRRLRTMWRLRDAERAPRVLVAPVRALVQRLGPHVEDVEPVVVVPGERRDRDSLVAALVGAGYRREEVVEHRGEVAVRGSIVDVYPSTADRPVRIDLWGDEVDRLTEFSVADQRSTVDVGRVEVFGCRELLPTAEVRERAERLVGLEPWGREQWERLAQGQTFDGMESWLPWLTEGEHVLFDLVASDALVLLMEPRRMRDRAADLLAEEADLAATLATTWGATAAGEDDGFPRLHLPFDRLLTHTDAPAWTVTTAPEGPEVATIASMGIAAAAGDPERVVRQLAELAADGYRIVVASDGEGSAARVRSLLSGHGLSPDIDIAPLERGCILPAIKLAVIAEHDLTGRRRAHRAARRPRRDAQGFFDDLKPGDHVVHHQHGVARYGGMVKRAIGGVERDYLLLEYKGDDRLYVPSDQIDAVRHYTGGDAPSLNRLGGDGWQRAKAKVRSVVSEIAQELVVLYQTRLHAPGHAFAVDSPWQRELEDAFPYQETPDQLTAITEVKGDMEADHPMDRLVCGDVGFGKTEVAIRAAFKAVQDGKQVAVLVPTTLLAQQHHQTFGDRFAGYPVRVEVLSRFLTAAQAREVAKGVRSGEVDVVIGTHRLLSDDIEFKDLGLLVVDEEQRFGVGHKEQIKQLKTGVDVLTLSATPIPRTLEMSLTGIRDLTLLNTPPADRMPILTYVGEYDDRAVGEAIRRELLREGQVFYVHNRVQDIERTADHVRDLVPEARVAIAHGQMDEGTLEQVVLAFWEGDYDVLVCTTIIESGIDMPTVNTLVVDRADLLGLGQMHQLRGRVGRSGQRAYAYLFVPQDRVLSEEAYERLKTIGEATELGSGFKIAMRDLEIRGAGNLLGTGQSGHIAAVGYDLYCQMVSEAVAELKGEPVREPAEIKLDLPLAANLPREYVQKEELRLEAYRRLASVTTDGEVADIRLEWEDRYGPLPPPAEALLAVARLRAEASRTGVREVTVVKPSSFGGAPSTARLSPLPLKTSQQIRLKRLHPTAVYKEPDQLLIVKVPHRDHPADWLVDLLRELEPVSEPQPAQRPVVPLPQTGMSKDDIIEVLEAYRGGDARWQDGRTFGMVYDAGPEAHQVVEAVAAMFLHDNALNTNAFPSLAKIQSQVVRIAIDLLHGGDAAGFMTSGGTESILCAVKAARERGRDERGVTEPEMVLPASAHAAFHKAAHYFGVQVHKVPVRDDWRADVDAMAACVNDRTVLVVGSAPQYPQGVIDPIPELAALAAEVGASFHTDACMGGFFLPFVEQLGQDVPPWDFRVEGVTTISADLHKLGYAPKGASVLLHRTKALRRYQTFVFDDWLGGFYASPGMQGTRPGLPMATAWATLHHLGLEGYLRLTQATLDTRERMVAGVRALPGLTVLGEPEAQCVAISTAPGYEDLLDVFAVGDALLARGWHLDRQKPPDSLHATVSAGNQPVIDDFLRDLATSVTDVGGTRLADRSTSYATLE